MKVDKDAILKQKFWISLGAFGVLWLVALLAVWMNGGGDIESAKKKFTDADGAIKKYTSPANRPKNANFLQPWNDYASTFKLYKDEAWKAAWDGAKSVDPLPAGEKRWEGQKGLYTWPSSRDHPLDENTLYPDTPLDIAYREWFRTKEGYASQFDALYADLKTDKGSVDPSKPPPDLRNAVDFIRRGSADEMRPLFDALMRPVDWTVSARAPDPEECWIAQEDFWVRREVLYTIWTALAMAGRMDLTNAADGFKSPDPNKYAARQVFRNGAWEVQLLFEKNDKGGYTISPDSTITNVHVSHREQDLGDAFTKGVWFRLRQDGADVRVFAFDGEKTAYLQPRVMGKGSYTKGWALVAGDPTRPMELTQAFDATNTPIFHVDEIRIPYLSQRNSNRPLIPAKPERYPKKESASPTTATPGPGGSSAIPPISLSPTPAGSGPGGTGVPGAAGQGSGNRTPNVSLDRNRYIFVTDQSRHLPLAMDMVVDQSHIHEILAALANSRLRFQTTQVEFCRARGAGSGAAASPVPGGTSASPAPISTFPGSAPPGAGPLQPGAGAPGTAVPQEENPNLVELTVYGIASLYERPRAQ